MFIQDSSAYFVQRRLNCLDLPNDINTVLIFFQHMLDASYVTLNGFKALNILLVVMFHNFSPNPLPHGGLS
jgi:hypothetical protein